MFVFPLSPQFQLLFANNDVNKTKDKKCFCHFFSSEHFHLEGNAIATVATVMHESSSWCESGLYLFIY